MMGSKLAVDGREDNVSTVQRTKAKENENGFLRLSSNTPQAT